MSPAKLIKQALLKTMTLPALPELVASLAGTEVTILMLHRFAFPGAGIEGHDPALIRAVLAYLRKHRYALVSLEDAFRRLRAGEPMKRAVVFTIDDGYFDQAEIGAPLFAEFDCPATIFVTTGFLDGRNWMWWDQIHDIFDRTVSARLELALGPRRAAYRLDSPEARLGARREVSAWCEDAAQADREAVLAELSRAAGVEIPAAPPAAFAPLSWDQARRLEARGISFGAHTVTHPILASTSAEHAGREIAESWRRLREEVSRPVPVFCYPGGRARDFGPREMEAARRLGFWGAVIACPGKIRAAKYREGAPALFRVPRLPLPADFARVLKAVSGMEDLSLRVRGIGA